LKFLKIVVPLALGIALIWYFYSKFSPEQWEELKLQIKNANYFIVVVSVLMNVISHLIRSVRWNLLLVPLGYQTTLKNRLLSICVAYFMNLFIPKSGEVTRGVLLDKYEDVPFEKGFGTIISERIVDLFFLLVFTLIAVSIEFDRLFGYVSDLISIDKLLLLAALGIAFLIISFLFIKYSKGKVAQKIKTFLIGLKDGVMSIFKMKKKGLFIIQSLIIWLLYVISFYIATQALEATSEIGVGTTIIAFVVGSFTFAFTNSGVGYYPLAIAGILLLFGVPETTGNALGWIAWSSNIFSILFFGVLAMVLLPWVNKDQKNLTSSSR